MPDSRLYENLRLFFPDVSICVRFGDFPKISPVEEIKISEWIPFNAASTRMLNRETGIHMFLHDYQFERLWNSPTKYIPMLQKAGAVCSPDFSMYMDTPTALNMYNHYRKHWLAAYWQMNAITVIPTICWSDAKSFSWCFDGEPNKSIVAVSSIGIMKSKEARDRFVDGYTEMIRRLEPSIILFMGHVPEGCQGNIIQMPIYTDQIQKRR